MSEEKGQMAPIITTEPFYQPMYAQIELQVDGIKHQLMCDQVHMSNMLEQSAIASESEHDFGALKSVAPKNAAFFYCKNVYNGQFPTTQYMYVRMYICIHMHL